MADLFHLWGEDIQYSAVGDLLLVDGSEAGKQRVLRRILTNPGDLLFHLDYGAGLPAKVGETTAAAALEPTVRRQMLNEAAVSQDPPPDVTVRTFFGGAAVDIVYRDATTGQPVPVGFTVRP